MASKVAGLDADRLQSLLLRIGLAFVFLYAAVTCLIDPVRFATYMPPFLPPTFVDRVCLPVFSAYEVVLAACLLTGRWLFAASLLAAATMAGIIVINPDAFELLFRNVAIAFAALALAVQAWQKGAAGRAQAAAASALRPLDPAVLPPSTTIT